MISQFERTFTKLVAPLKRRVLTTVRRAIINTVNDALMAQAVQIGVNADEVHDNVERFGEYGLISWPNPNAEAIAVAIGGNSAHTVVIATEDRATRPKGKLVQGDVGLWRSDMGILVWLKANGMVELGPSPTNFVALANLVKTEISALRNTVNAHITNYNTHTHVVGGTLPTGPVAATAAATLATSSAPAAVNDVAAVKVKAI